ncbi:MAG: helix-turn-helix domain-containing protein [Bacteroidales bacterium]|nr:helix-turn-helix domain-containing protein [Bacteroidales bacterium]
MKRFDRLEQLALLGAKNVLTLEEVCLLTGLAKSSVYKLTSTRSIPHYRADNGKHLYFKKSEVEDWLTRNRIGSQLEDEQKAIAEHFCNKVKKGGLK